MKVFLCLIVLPALAYSLQFKTLCYADIKRIKYDIKCFYEDNPECQAPGLRLGIHDCIGGCDGCINTDLDGNEGLVKIIPELEKVYSNHSDIISRADFWQLAGMVAIDLGVYYNNDYYSHYGGCERVGKCVPYPKFHFQWGRQDCPTSPFTDEQKTLPSPKMTGESLREKLKEVFGFSTENIVAIMGAHSLGGAHLDISGYNGKFTVEGKYSRYFNNEYYKTILTSKMENINVAPQSNCTGDDCFKFQFRAYDRSTGCIKGNLLNTDLGLYKNLELNTTTFQSMCDWDKDCPDAPGAQFVRQFASNVDYWVRCFTTAYEKLQCTGYDFLYEIE